MQLEAALLKNEGQQVNECGQVEHGGARPTDPGQVAVHGLYHAKSEVRRPAG